MNSSDGVDEMDVASLAEAYDLECKAAQGRDGRGELPDDVWKSYSAMANADGGVILLGVQEKPRGSFRALGLADVERVRKALWDNLHNRKQVSVNLLTEADVQPITLDGKTVLRICVPRATRQQRPVHLGSNPFGGTYLRRHEGDYPADDEAVRRLMAERVEDSRDERVPRALILATWTWIRCRPTATALLRSSPVMCGPTFRYRSFWRRWAPWVKTAMRATAAFAWRDC